MLIPSFLYIDFFGKTFPDCVIKHNILDQLSVIKINPFKYTHKVFERIIW